VRPPVRRHVLAVAIVAASLVGPSVAVAAPIAPAAGAPASTDATSGIEARVEGAQRPVLDAGACEQVLPGSRSGPRALSELGSRLPEVAARNGLATAELRSRLTEDDALHVDRCGRLYFVDRVPEPADADHTEAGHDHTEAGHDHTEAGHDHSEVGHDHSEVGHDQRSSAAISGAQGPTVEALAVRGPLVALAETFELQSRPGSQRIIYLDFDGHTLSGTGWNGGASPDVIELPPFSIDGDPSFSNDELAFIQRVWQRVAEDFAPFDVNVTTQDLGPDALVRSDLADQTYGTRAIVTSHDPATSKLCEGCAGLGYVGTFDAVGGGVLYPALTFVYGSIIEAQMVADTVSHEVGHNLGLFHHDDVTSDFGYSYGQGLWAPIMGSSILPLSTWSVGDYAGATTVQDDVATIAATGAPLAADDHGDDAASATPVGTASTTRGVIGSRADEDWFRFTADGPMTITASPVAEGPNLDVELQILADDGTTVVASDDPVSSWPHLGGPRWVWYGLAPVTGLDASVDSDLPAGTYYARVRGVGSGDPLTTGYSDYGSLGRYTLEVAPEGVVPPPPGDGPVVTITSAPPALTRDATVAFAFAATPAVGTTFECRVDLGAWQSCTSPRSVTVAGQGIHTFAVRGTADGVTAAPVTRSWTLDTIAPDLRLTGSPAEGASTTLSTANLSWDPTETLREAATCRLLRDGSAVVPWQPCGNEFGGGVSLSGLSPAAYRFELRGTDLAGNVGTASRSWTVTGSTPPPTPPPAPAPTFSDVAPGSTHARAIGILAQREVTLGCGGTRFCPDQPVTRDQMATFLGRALELRPGSTTPPFLDVSAGSTHARYIDAVRRENITLGCGDGKRYCPRDVVARDQMASFLQRALKYEPGSSSPPFRDVRAGSTHARAIDALRREEVTTGCSTPGSYCPGAAVTRAQMATFLVRALGW
jgi:hypothetical protein